MKTESYEVKYVGLELSGEKFILPRIASDPASPADGWMWYNETDEAARVRINGVTVTIGAGTITAVDDTATLDLVNTSGTITGNVLNSPLLGGENGAFYRARANHTGTQLAATISDFSTAADARVTALVNAAFINALTGIDADTLNGSSAAQIQSAVTAAIVDSAPGTLDTLSEIAAALGDDPDFLATITALANSRARTHVENLDGGAATEVVTHNLNTRDILEPTVYVNSGNYQDEGYIFQRTTVNTVTVVSEAGNIPAGRRIVIVAVGT